MTDPLDILRTPVTPADPDPTFAARLRARVERALALPRGVAMTTTTAAPAAETAVPAAAGAAIPYLAVSDARRAIDWYVEVFGARQVGEPIVMPDGRVGHAELEVSGGTLYLSDEHPEIGVVGPRPSAASVSLVLTVPDVDATIAAATRAGGQLTREPYEGYGHRNATVVDPFQHRWMLQTPLPAAAPSYRHGDIGYVSVWVPDVDRAAAFYESVLGWTYAPQHGPQSRQVVGSTSQSRRSGPRAGRRTSRPTSRTAVPRRASTTRARRSRSTSSRPDRPVNARRRTAYGRATSATSPCRSSTPRGPAPSTAPCSAGGSARAGCRTVGASRTSSR